MTENRGKSCVFLDEWRIFVDEEPFTNNHYKNDNGLNNIDSIDFDRSGAHLASCRKRELFPVPGTGRELQSSKKLSLIETKELPVTYSILFKFHWNRVYAVA